MDNKLLVGVGVLIIGFAAGYMVAPGGAPGDGMYRGGMSQNIDRHFIEQMIPHHEGAIAMAQLALERSKRPEVLSLAQGIIDSQTLEITQMKGWYSNWFGGAPIEDGHRMHMDGMSGDIEELKTATNFDQEFLTQMIPHHEMAVMMAQMLAASTQRTEMKVLADQIITSQGREITMMRSWLASW